VEKPVESQAWQAGACVQQSHAGTLLPEMCPMTDCAPAISSSIPATPRLGPRRPTGRTSCWRRRKGASLGQLPTPSTSSAGPSARRPQSSMSEPRRRGREGGTSLAFSRISGKGQSCIRMCAIPRGGIGEPLRLGGDFEDQCGSTCGLSWENISSRRSLPTLRSPLAPLPTIPSLPPRFSHFATAAIRVTRRSL